MKTEREKGERGAFFCEVSSFFGKPCLSNCLDKSAEKHGGRKRFVIIPLRRKRHGELGAAPPPAEAGECVLTILKFIAAGGEPRKNCYTILGKRGNIKTAREENWRFGDRKEKSLLVALGD